MKDEFGKELRRLQYENEPEMPFKHLNGIGQGVIELIINGSPGFRCVYVAKFADTVVVLHSFIKTTNGVDRQAMRVAESRFKELKAQLRQCSGEL